MRYINKMNYELTVVSVSYFEGVSVSPMYVSEVLLSLRLTVAWCITND